jgi:hypothetical protein
MHLGRDLLTRRVDPKKSDKKKHYKKRNRKPRRKNVKACGTNGKPVCAGVQLLGEQLLPDTWHLLIRGTSTYLRRRRCVRHGDAVSMSVACC